MKSDMFDMDLKPFVVSYSLSMVLSGIVRSQSSLSFCSNALPLLFGILFLFVHLWNEVADVSSGYDD